MSDQDPDNPNLEPEALYRDLPPEAPPPELDRAILQHAAARKHRSGFRWDTFGRRFAAAAVVVFAVGIYFQTDFAPETTELHSIDSMSEPAMSKTINVTEDFSEADIDVEQDVAAPAPEPARERAEPTRKRATTDSRQVMALDPGEAALADSAEETRYQASDYSANEIEEVIVTGAARTSSSDDRPLALQAATANASGGVMESLHTNPIFDLQPCHVHDKCIHELRHIDCEAAYKVPIGALNLEFDDDVFIFSVEDKDYFVRCLAGSWTEQSQNKEEEK